MGELGRQGAQDLGQAEPRQEGDWGQGRGDPSLPSWLAVSPTSRPPHPPACLPPLVSRPCVYIIVRQATSAPRESHLVFLR